MENNFNIELAKIFRRAEEERFNLRHPYVGTEHLLLAVLKEDKEMASFLENYHLTYENFKKELVMVVGSATKESELNLYTPLLKRVINSATINAKENNKGKVTVKHLILALLEEGEGIAVRLLVGMNIDIDEIYEDLNKENKLTNKKLDIYEIGNVLNDIVALDENVIGRDKELNLIIECLLRKKKNNPILIGDAGVGKTAIVEELTRRIIKYEVPEQLYNAKIVSLEMGSLVSGTKYRGEFEEKLTKIIKELENNQNIILFIDEIHAMVNAGGAEGAITAGDIFKPALARGKIKVIGATTNEEYNRFFAKDKALMRRFEVININEPNKEETLNILKKVKGEYEEHHNVIIPSSLLPKIIDYTDKFISNKKNPDKAIDFLDSVCSRVQTMGSVTLEKKKIYEKLSELKFKKEESVKNNNYDEALNIYNEELLLNKKFQSNDFQKKRKVTENDIISVLENKTNTIFTKEKLKYLSNLQKEVKKKLYGLDNYVDEIVDTIRTSLLERKGMLKIYLEGEKYLGKSSLVKIISEYMKPTNYLKIDLKDYKNSGDINKLIGTPQGYIGYNDEHLFSKLKNNCFSIILFDNFNEGAQNIQYLIKEILKEGSIQDNKGDTISFNNSVIFLTNDVKTDNKVGFINNSDDYKYNELFDLVDSYLVFKKLDKETISNYLDSMNISNKEEIIKKSNYEKYNYKNVDKLIKQNHLQNV